MTLPVAGLRTWEGAMWRRTAIVRRAAIASAWLAELARTRVALPVLPPWEALAKSLPMTAAPEEPARPRAQAKATSWGGRIRDEAGRPQAGRLNASGAGRLPSRGTEGGSRAIRHRDLRSLPPLPEPPASAVVRELLRQAAAEGSQPPPAAYPVPTEPRPETQAQSPGGPATPLSARRAAELAAAGGLPPGGVQADLLRVIVRGVADSVLSRRQGFDAGPAAAERSAQRIVQSAMRQALGGERAPAEVLTSLTRRSPERPPAPAPVPHLRGEQAVGAGDAGTAAPGRIRAGAPAEREPSVPRPPADEVPLHPMGLASRESMPAPDAAVSVVAAAAGSATRVFPPQATPSMPPMLPEKVAQPPAYGLAGPVTRIMTRPEDASEQPDDLGALAGKIKLILVEEARRHGIAV